MCLHVPVSHPTAAYQFVVPTLGEDIPVPPTQDPKYELVVVRLSRHYQQNILIKMLPRINLNYEQQLVTASSKAVMSQQSDITTTAAQCKICSFLPVSSR